MEAGTEPTEIWQETFQSGDPAALNDLVDQVNTNRPDQRTPAPVPSADSSSDPPIGIIAGAGGAVIVLAAAAFVAHKKGLIGGGGKSGEKKDPDVMTSRSMVVDQSDVDYIDPTPGNSGDVASVSISLVGDDDPLMPTVII